MWKSNEHSKIAGFYEFKNTLGRGHFAVVKLAEHVFSGEKVAIKVIDKTKMDQISAEHLYHEVTCMKLVQHPNVVRLYEVIETPSKLYLILELGDGGDMFDYIMRHDKGLHEDIAKDYFAQILSAIAYCHQLHVVHRDLKPENVVFFESQGLVKLTDFGFSNRYKPGEKLSTSCGSLAYSAPEILLGEEYDAPAVDVWSLGVILYMLVCGVAPFNEANDSETLTNIMDCRYKVLDHVSHLCQDLIQRMLKREPLERIDLNEIMSHPWLAGVCRSTPPILSRTSVSDELHQNIIATMLKGDFAGQNEIERAVHEDRYDYITATYFLLAERALLQQQEEEDEDMSFSLSNAMEEDEISDSSTKSCFSSALPIPKKLRPLSESDDSVRNKLYTTYSVSPPCKQATLLPPPSTLLDPIRRRTFSSGSDDSTSSFQIKNPSFIREHLTITPRHGFSVAHGGIDALIEEEERSKSQTTTDDEIDVGDDISELNPNALASCLQRTSLQRVKSNDIKRIKKRKSAPTLNEICEEVEEDSMEKVSYYRSNFHPSGRHSISTSSPTAHPHRAHGRGMPRKATASEFKSHPKFGSRIGGSHRKEHSLRPSSSEASEDDEVESRRESSSNLSSIASSLLRRRHDSSDDDDRGCGGREYRTIPLLEGGTRLDDVAEQDPSTSIEGTDVGENNADGGRMEERSCGDQFSLNNATELRYFKKFLFLKSSNYKMTNRIGIRSRSAESHSSCSGMHSSRSSSSRSSCSSLSAHYLILNRKVSLRVVKNSSSTRSDTGLVLRCNDSYAKRKLNNSKLVASSFSFDASTQHPFFSLEQFVANGDSADNTPFSSSLPRRLRKGAARAYRSRTCTLKEAQSGSSFSLGFGENQIFKTLSRESLAATKRSNLSLVSSTCSASKFIVDPVNELTPLCLTPVPESASRDSSAGLIEETYGFFVSSEDKTNPNENIKSKNIGILTKLNNLKNASYGNKGALSSDHPTKHTIIRKVKHQNCCTVM